MRHLTFNNNKFHTAILIKSSSLIENRMATEYLEPLTALGYDTSGIVGISLDYADKKKPLAVDIKKYLSTLVPVLHNLNIKYLLVCDSEYFKKMGKLKKVAGEHGYIKEYEGMHMVMGYNYGSFFHNPDLRNNLNLSLKALNAHSEGVYAALGEGIIHSEYYPSTLDQIAHTLQDLHQYDELTCDIEAFSLKHYEAGIGTIAFARDKHNGIAFLVDYKSLPEPQTVLNSAGNKTNKSRHGEQIKNQPIRKLLKDFFKSYTGKLTYHNSGYDMTVLIYQLWMKDLLDQKGLLLGLDIMTNNFDDTQHITYLATNTTSGNHLSLKEQSHEYTGNYAQEEIKDISLIPEPDLLRYNLVDCCATWYVKEKNFPLMKEAKQLKLYEEIFLPSTIDVIQIQLTGMCLDMVQVLKAEDELSTIRKSSMQICHSSKIIKSFIINKKYEEVTERNEAYKKKVITVEDTLFEFNPNSNPQMQELIYTYMELPIIDYTKNKAPACGGDTIKKLLNHTTNTDYLAVLNALLRFIEVDKILGTFIKVFKEAPQAKDGHYYVYGSYKLGGTVSGRMSSSNPNMQQIPSGSTFGKLIKKCFIAASGWVFAGADSASLEDRIDALLTKDKNKLKVYTQGFDGHALRSFYYFPDQIPEIADKVAKKTLAGKFYKITEDGGNVEYYHEDDLSEEAKIMLKL